MALQQITLYKATNNDWFKKSAFTTASLFVAGLLFTALMYNRPPANGSGANGTGQQPCVTAAKQASNGTVTTSSKASERASAPAFSIMPGGLNRFLQ